jgi:hypothetical protein
LDQRHYEPVCRCLPLHNTLRFPSLTRGPQPDSSGLFAGYAAMTGRKGRDENHRSTEGLAWT